MRRRLEAIIRRWFATVARRQDALLQRWFPHWVRYRDFERRRRGELERARRWTPPAPPLRRTLTFWEQRAEERRRWWM